MGEELKRAIKSPQMWASLIVCFITLMGYSLGSWIGCILIDEWMEYRESALQLSLGGIFFGGFMMLLPFCAALAHSTSQIDDMGSREPLINHRYFITIDKSVRENSLSRAFSGFGFPVIRS